MTQPHPTHGHIAKFFSPFETGHRLNTGWRWYWQFLRDYPEIDVRVEHDCFAALDRIVIA